TTFPPEPRQRTPMACTTHVAGGTNAVRPRDLSPATTHMIPGGCPRSGSARAKQPRKSIGQRARMALLFSSGGEIETSMDAADPRWRQLGVVLLEAGLLSERDL